MPNSKYNFNFQSSSSKYSPKNKFKKKLKFNNDIPNLNSTDSNNEHSLKYNTNNYDFGYIKSEIDIEEHELSVIKQELETDSNASSPIRKKKKSKELSAYYQLGDYHDPGKKSKGSVEREYNQTLTNNEFKKELEKFSTYSETDSQNEDCRSHVKQKKKRKKDKKLVDLNNEDNPSFKTEPDSSLSSEKPKKNKHKEHSLNSETDSAADSSITKKKKKKDNQHELIHDQETTEHKSNNEQLEIDSSSPAIKSNKKKREASQDNCEINFESKLSEENVENSKRKKKKKKKTMNDESGIDTEMNHDRNETELETNSLNNNETNSEVHPEKAKKKKKKHKGKEQNIDNESNSNLDQDQDNEIDIECTTASNSNNEMQDNNDDKMKGNNEPSLHKNCFEMNSSNDEDSDIEYNRLRKEIYRDKKAEKSELFDKFKKMEYKEKINIISNQLLNSSQSYERTTTTRSHRKKSLYACRYEGYSSNDEHDSHSKPKVDHNTTLEDVLEISSEDDEDFLEKYYNIHVILPFEVPPLHKIETHIGLPLSNQTRKEIQTLGLKIKTGPFSKQEDDIILKNWTDFCEVHELSDDARPFIKISVLKKVASALERLNFVRFLARNLNNRILYSVYNRFRRLMENKTKRYGKFTAEEDRIILDYLGQTDDKNPYTKLAKILNRDSALINKRVKKLTNNMGVNEQIKWDKEKCEDVVKNLLKVTGTNDIYTFKKRTITLKEWKKISDIMKIPAIKLKYAWDHRIYRELFYLHDEISTAEIRTKLINKLYEMEVTDFRTINWHKLAKNFDGLSAANLCKYFHNILQYHVPRNYHENAEECLSYLQNQLLTTYQFATKKVKKLCLDV